MAHDRLAELLKATPLLGVTITFLILSWFAVALRLWTRSRIVRNTGADDWAIIATLLLYTGLCIQLMRLGVIELTVDLLSHPDIFALVAYLLLSIFCLYIVTAIAFKISLAIFFVRLVNKKWQRWVIYSTIGLYSLFSVSFFFVALFECGNPDTYLGHGKLLPTPKCFPYKTVLKPLNYTQSIMNAVTDWMFAIIPIFVVRGTQMSRQARISVIAILCLGIVGSVCSIVRIFYVDVLQVSFGITLLKQAPSFAILSATELGIGIVSICCATLRPLFQRYFGLSVSDYSSGRARGQTAPTGDMPTRRTAPVRSRTLGTEIDIEHELELELGHMEPEHKAGAITVTTLIARDVEANVGRKSQDSEKELL